MFAVFRLHLIGDGAKGAGSKIYILVMFNKYLKNDKKKGISK